MLFRSVDLAFGPNPQIKLLITSLGLRVYFAYVFTSKSLCTEYDQKFLLEGFWLVNILVHCNAIYFVILQNSSDFVFSLIVYINRKLLSYFLVRISCMGTWKAESIVILHLTFSSVSILLVIPLSTANKHSISSVVTATVGQTNRILPWLDYSVTSKRGSQKFSVCSKK